MQRSLTTQPTRRWWHSTWRRCLTAVCCATSSAKVRSWCATTGSVRRRPCPRLTCLLRTTLVHHSVPLCASLCLSVPLCACSKQYSCTTLAFSLCLSVPLCASLCLSGLSQSLSVPLGSVSVSLSFTVSLCLYLLRTTLESTDRSSRWVLRISRYDSW
jgi:hypothetical protein